MSGIARSRLTEERKGARAARRPPSESVSLSCVCLARFLSSCEPADLSVPFARFEEVQAFVPMKCADIISISLLSLHSVAQGASSRLLRTP